ANLQKEQLQTEKELYKNSIDTRIQAIESRVETQKNASDLAISNIEREKSAQELLNASIERTAKITESRFNLAKAISDAAIVTKEIQLESVARAGELKKRLEDPNLAPLIRFEIKEQIARSGINPDASALEFVQRRQEIEEEISKARLEALRIEQQFQRKALQLDLQRQEIAAKSAQFDAQSQIIRSQQAIIEAEGKLEAANKSKDANAIAAANLGIILADRQLDLSNRQLDNAAKNLSVQSELSRNATLAQNATQEAALAQANAAIAAKRQASALEQAETSISKIGTNLSALGSEEKQNKKPRFSSIFEASRRAMFGQSNEPSPIPTIKTTRGLAPEYFNLKAVTQRTPSAPFAMPSPSVEGINELSKAQKLEPTNNSTNFSDSLKSAVKGVEARLDKLNETIGKAINSPRSLYVSSPEPITDAVSILADLNRLNVQSSGLG
ncbi:hypothetical protein, partial [Chroococcidiopsis sp.]|uniref:hypothetical protein n=1 Tax=Chroococcidiopsis sp. TaxID=3088168 RepID=UPI003F3E5EC8